MKPLIPAFLAIAVFASSCATRDDNTCVATLDSTIWRLVGNNTDPRIKPRQEENSVWYRSAEGNFFICHAPAGRYKCNGIYETYTLSEFGTFEHQDIVCHL